MNDQELLRYSRQILLPQFDVTGQERLQSARVLLVGLGGLGSPVALYLAAAGIGHLVLVDYDRVDITNLQRQIIHATADVGRPKVESARDRVTAINPSVQVTAICGVLEGATLEAQVAEATLVIDATDNFAARFALNAACVKARKPLVSGAAIRMEGQVSVFMLNRPNAPCYRCLYKDENELAETCSQTGVLGPVVGTIGSIQALEAIKVLTGMGEPLAGRILLFDALRMEWRNLRLRQDPACPVCGSSHRT